jgi:hypothetical protein
MIMNRRIARALAVLTLLAPALASAQARVLQFRSVEDPSPPDPAICDVAPFKANVRIRGTLFTYQTREGSGEVETDEGRAIGKATACARITNFLFPEGLAQQFFLLLTLRDGVYRALGTCTIISNNVPESGLVLAGCNLKIDSATAPAGVIGGAVTSVTTFNPFKLAGFATGSYWTAQIYDEGHGRSRQEDSDHAMEWIDGGGHDPGK